MDVPMIGAAALRARALLLLCGLGAAAACASRAPSADRPAPPPPMLDGRTVMVLPVQPTAGAVPAGLDAEIAYWLADRAPAVRWVLPADLDRAIARSPALNVRVHALAVSSFFRAEVRRIGDPLFGDLRRVGAVVDARYALLPVAGGYVSRPDGAGRVELAVAIIDTIGGDVLWYGVIGGDPGDEADPTVFASAAQSLARTLFPR